MNKYETIIIINSNADSETIEKVISSVENLISNDGGNLINKDNWGRKRLAYEIRGNKDGFYVLFKYEADPAFIQRFERYLVLNEQIIKYMTVRAEKLPEPRQKQLVRRSFREDDNYLRGDIGEFGEDEEDEYGVFDDDDE